MPKKVLVIISSVIPENESYSTELWKRFIKYYKNKNPQDEIIELDLNKELMAEKTLTRQNFKEYFNNKDSDKYINQLKSVNKVVVSSQMMNFNIPGILKNYIDHVWVANKTFSYKYAKKGDAVGLLSTKYLSDPQFNKNINNFTKIETIKVQILATQGAPKNWYPWGDHVNYLKGTFEFLGCEVTEPILVDGTKIIQESDKIPEEILKDKVKHKDLIQKFISQQIYNRINFFDEKIKTLAENF